MAFNGRFGGRRWGEQSAGSSSRGDLPPTQWPTLDAEIVNATLHRQRPSSNATSTSTSSPAGATGAVKNAWGPRPVVQPIVDAPPPPWQQQSQQPPPPALPQAKKAAAPPVTKPTKAPEPPQPTPAKKAAKGSPAPQTTPQPPSGQPAGPTTQAQLLRQTKQQPPSKAAPRSTAQKQPAPAVGETSSSQPTPAAKPAEVAEEHPQPQPQPQPQPSAAPPRQPSSPSAPSLKEAPFDAYIVLDFEATCVEGTRISQPEVIEFPMVVVDPTTATVVAEFQRYVRPVVRPILTAFCTELTGITQDVVDRSETFKEVYREAMGFLRRAGFGDAPPQRSYCLVTCGDWDLATMLPAQLNVSGSLGVPETWHRWCNLKKFMSSLQPPLTHQPGGRPSRFTGMSSMLRAFGLELQGRHHSGIDDCRNIAQVVCALLHAGYTITPTNVTPDQYTPWKGTASDLPPLHELVSSVVPPELCPPPSKAPAEPGEPARDNAGTKRERRDTQRGTATAAASATPAAAAAPEMAGTATSSSAPRNRNAPAQKAGGTQPVVRVFLDIDPSRDPVHDLLGARTDGPGERPALPPARIKSISKAMSRILRHGADQSGIPISENGFVLAEDLFRDRVIRREGATLTDFADVVVSNDKQRFRMAYGLADGRVYIAANQGHSMEGINPDLHAVTSATEVPVAIHGTYRAAWNTIQQCGYLSTMTRAHIHFAKGLPTDGDVISGMRKDVDVLLYLDVEKALQDGVPILLSANGVVLTPGVGSTKQLPLRYISKVVNKRTGETVSPQ